MSGGQRHWRDVPLPLSIAGLRRARGGLPIPYVVSWEGEDDMVIRDWGPMHQRAVFPARELVGVTRPVFGVMEPSRQRQVVSEVRCQVCFTELPPIKEELDASARVHWLSDRLQEPATFKGHKVALEPWVCGDCLVYALQVCPGMIQRQSPVQRATSRIVPRVPVLAVLTANLIAVIGRIGGGSSLAGQTAVTYCKIEPLEYRRLNAHWVLEYGPATLAQMIESELVP